MEEILAGHAAIMDKADPEKRVGMVVDEWGTWYDVEPDTELGFLYQQNTLRDAIVAALNFHIFHRHADRVVMANIAQTVNVLQAVILTDGPRMLRTPTYWAFEMFKVHQGGTFLPVALESPDYVFGGERIPAVSASATRDQADAVHLSVVNADPNRSFVVKVKLAGIAPTSVTGRLLTAPAITAHNTFDAPDAVSPKEFDEVTLKDGTLELQLPSKSIVIVELR
jgi:alpha-N-arabinofuranosidase